MSPLPRSAKACDEPSAADRPSAAIADTRLESKNCRRRTYKEGPGPTLERFRHAPQTQPIWSLVNENDCKRASPTHHRLLHSVYNRSELFFR